MSYRLNGRLGSGSGFSLALVAGLALAIPVIGQEGSRVASADASPRAGQDAAAGRPDSKELLGDFVHFVLIDNAEVAAGLGQELLDREMSDADFVKLVESTGDVARFENVATRAMRMEALQPVASQMLKRFESGQLARARDPEQVAANIKALTSTIRARLQGEARLRTAGEYATPQLLSALLDGSNPMLQTEVRRVLVSLGRQAITPLGTALPGLTPEQQESVADVLGNIPHRNSLPYLVDVGASTQNSRVREACDRAIQKLGGTNGVAPGDLYAQLAEGYWEQRPELTSFPGEDHQLLWSFRPQTGLAMQAIRTEVFHEAMAMRHAERALALSSENPEALSLWVASNLKRDLESPAGYENPAYSADRRGADYFAAAAGPGVMQRVLARALDGRNAPLARRAISALEKTAGGTALWGDSTGAQSAGRRPLVEALSFPNRRVQYEAALAIAAAQPAEGFPGSERVVPTLSSAVRDAGVMVALVLADDAEAQQGLRSMLQNAGFRVLPAGRSVEEVEAPLAEASAVDLVVVRHDSPDGVSSTIDAVRAQSKLAATPVLVLANSAGLIEMERRHGTDSMIAVRPASMGEQTFARAAASLMQTATGGAISPEEALGYSIRSLASMRDLSIANGPVLNVRDAASEMLAVLADKDTKPDIRKRVAEILSRVGEERAQRGIMDAALAASGDARIAMLEQVAGSARRFGNLLENRHIARLVELAGGKGDAEATSAAALMGALNLPNERVMSLITGDSNK